MIGAYLTGSFNGTIDEVRISNTVKSAQWIATEYNNQSATSTFYTTGVQQPNVAPSAPTLVSPADASNTTDTTPTLSANYTDADAGDVGTTSYRISSVSAQDCLDNGTIVSSGTSSETATVNETTSYTPSSSIGADGTYYWCAQNNDSVAQSSWTTMGSFTLDTTAPTVLNISSDYANGNYTTSTVIDIDVTFSENVTSDGDVTITLETGDSDQTCTFTITSTNTATCDYTTVAGDNSSDLTVGNVSGTITDTAGNTMVDFTPTTNLADNKAIVIDTTAPTSVDIATITADSSSQITITSVSSTDALAGMHASPYWFNETSGNSGATPSSIYQGSKTYIDTGLTPNTQYSYQVKAQDLLSNISSYSTVVASTTIYTLANIPSTPALTVNSASKITATWGANSNPSGTNYYIENTTKGTNSGWTTGSSWTSTGLDCNTSYTFQVKAKNGDGVETANSNSVSATTNDCGLASFFMPGLFGGPADSSEGGDTSVETPQEVVVISEPEVVTSEDLTIEDKEDLQDLGVLPEEEIIIPNNITDAIDLEDNIIVEDTLKDLKDTPLVINELEEDGLELVDISLERLEEVAQYAKLSNDLDTLTKKFPSLASTLEKTKINLNTKKDLENIKGVSFTLPGITNSIVTGSNVSSGALAKESIKSVSVATSNSLGQVVNTTVKKVTPLAEMSKEVKEALPEDLVFVRTGDESMDLSTKVTVTSDNKIEKKLNVSSNQDLKLAIKPTNNIDVEGVKGYLVLKDIDRNSMSNLTTKPVKTAWYNSLISPVYAMDLRLPKIHQDGKVLGEQDEISPLRLATPVEMTEREDNASNEKPKELLVLMEFDYTDLDNDGIYTTDIKTPPIEGTFEILTAISYKYQRSPKIVRLTTVIDPEGYVYYIDDETGAKARIKGAKVSLYQKTLSLRESPQTTVAISSTDEQYILWPASEFNQINPQITTDNGKYSFLVPEGTYYLLVEADNYNSYQSKTFKVEEGNSVHENIELVVVKVWWSIFVSWKFWIAIGVIVIIVLLTMILLKNKK